MLSEVDIDLSLYAVEEAANEAVCWAVEEAVANTKFDFWTLARARVGLGPSREG